MFEYSLLYNHALEPGKLKSHKLKEKEFLILKKITQEKKIPQKELCEWYAKEKNVTPAAAVHAIIPLEEMGFIHRTRVPSPYGTVYSVSVEPCIEYVSLTAKQCKVTPPNVSVKNKSKRYRYNVRTVQEREKAILTIDGAFCIQDVANLLHLKTGGNINAFVKSMCDKGLLRVITEQEKYEYNIPLSPSNKMYYVKVGSLIPVPQQHTDVMQNVVRKQFQYCPYCGEHLVMMGASE